MPPRDFRTTPTLDPVEDITRRRLLTALPALTLLAGGVSCGDDDDDDDDDNADPTGTSSPSATATPATRMVNHAFGQLEVPMTPERVVVTDNNALPYVLELGVVPVAAGALDGTFHEALTPLGAADITPFPRDDPDYELVASLDPDLIVGSSFTLLNRVKDGVATYERMAPLAAVDSDLPVFEQIRGYGRIVNREARAEELIAEFQGSIRSLAANVTVTNISIARAFGESDIFIYTGAEPFTSLWVELLGVATVPDASAATPAGTIIAPAERLGELQGEALIVISGIERLEQNPLWSLLPAVQADRVHHVGDYLTYAGNGGLSALRDQIVGIAEFLARIK